MWLPTVFTVTYLTAVFATINVQGVPGKPTLTRHPEFKVMYRAESVTFTCSVGFPSEWTFQWHHNGTKIPGSNSTYTIDALDYPSSGEYRCTTNGSTEPFSTEQSDPVFLQVSDLPKPVLKLESGLSDVFEDENVEFYCDADTEDSDVAFTWYLNKRKLQEDSAMVLDPDDSSLNITTIGKAHQGGYICQILLKNRTVKSELSNTVNITVYEIPAPLLRNLTWTDVFHGERVEMSCGMNGSPDWMFTWYKDGQEVHAGQGVSFDTNKTTLLISSASTTFKGEYKCRGHLNNRSVRTNFSSGVILSVYDKMPKVTLTQDPEYKVMFSGESIVLGCHINVSSGWEYMWTKDASSLTDAKNKLTINSPTKSNQGSYECQVKRGTSPLFFTAKSQVVNIMVEENKPKPLMTLQPDAWKVYIGEPVSFKCDIKDSAGWEYIWFKDEEIRFTGNQFDIPHARLADRGKYKCMGRRNKTKYDSLHSVEREVLISEIPSPKVEKSTPWWHVFPTESVRLNCEMDGSSDWMFTWYKDGQEVHAGQGLYFDTNKTTLFISSALTTFKGEYKCQGHLNNRGVSTNFSSGVILSVYDEMPKVTLTQDPEYKVMFSGESIVLGCHINVSSGWEYMWTKDASSLTDTKNKLTINSPTKSNQGSYECQVKRGTSPLFFTAKSQVVNIMVEENKPKPLMTLQPDAWKVYIGEPVSFKCDIKDSAGWEYIWFKDEGEIPFTGNQFDIPHARLADRGKYKCMGRRNKTKYDSLHSDEREVLISEIPSPKVEKSTPWWHVFPTESVRLNCEMNDSSDWMFTWYKDGQEVHAGQGVYFDKNKATLFISSALTTFKGEYKCQGHLNNRGVSTNFSSGVILSVYDTKPRVQLIQSPDHTLMHTEDSVSFLCQINISTGWEFLWYKDNHSIPVSGNNLTISSVLPKSTGSYKCQARRGEPRLFSSDFSPSISLTVEERPRAQISLLTGWSQAFLTNSLVLSCMVQESQDTWNYTWFKDGQEVDQSLSPHTEYTVTPQHNPEQSRYSCQGIRNGRPAYSRTSDLFETKNLLLKRRVLLSIALCIVVGIAAVCLGCIILRLCRKPVQEEFKPDEADLFLRMDALKDSDDGPCPLVQYITESALNTSPKDEGENGTISSETPLPETVQDEPATTTESPDATENNNGGLVSFKQ